MYYEFKRFMLGVVNFVVGSLILTLIMSGGTYALLGVTHVNATIDGKRLDGAIVEIDGKEAGVTPYESRLSFGSHSVRILPPKGEIYAEQDYSYTTFSMEVGHGLNAPFTSPNKDVVVSVTLNGRPLRGAIVEIDGEEVGTTPFHASFSPKEEHYIMVIPAGEELYAQDYCEWDLPAGFVGNLTPCDFTSLPANLR